MFRYAATREEALTSVKQAGQWNPGGGRSPTAAQEMAGCMTKALSILIILLMAVQIIKPLGLPGLRKRSDFWKLALGALALISLTVLLSHGR